MCRRMWARSVFSFPCGEDGYLGYYDRRLSQGLFFFLIGKPKNRLLLDRGRGLVQDQRQPRTHTRGTDEDDAEAHEYFHFHQTGGRGGHHRTRQV